MTVTMSKQLNQSLSASSVAEGIGSPLATCLWNSRDLVPPRTIICRPGGLYDTKNTGGSNSRCVLAEAGPGYEPRFLFLISVMCTSK
jgi:hypothetical protein